MDKKGNKGVLVMEQEEGEVVKGLEPGGLKESMIIPISEEERLEHEGVESPRLASKEGLGEDVAKLVQVYDFF